MKKRPVCDKCGTPLPHDSNFCSKCGDPVTEEDFLQLDVFHKKPKIEISFGFSPSAMYKTAVEFASKFPSYYSEGEGKHIKHFVSFDLEDIEAAINLWDMISGWKSAQLTVAGEPATKKDLVYGPLGCWRQRQKSILPEAYCFKSDEHPSLYQNIWGCFRLNIPNYSIFSSYGGFSSIDGTFLIIDKKSLAKKLAFGYLENRLCPALNKDFIMKTFEEIPEKIDLLTYEGPFAHLLEDAKSRALYEIERKKYREERENDKNIIRIQITGSNDSEYSEDLYDDQESVFSKKRIKQLIFSWWVWILLLGLLLIIFS